MSTVEGVKA